MLKFIESIQIQLLDQRKINKLLENRIIFAIQIFYSYKIN